MDRQLSATSQLSFSDSELDMIDFNREALSQHSHFFATSNPLQHRYSTPLFLLTPADETPSPAPHLRGSRSVTFSDDHLGLQNLGTESGGTQYVNKDSLAHDLSFLATMPELCDVTFLVGEDRQPVCAVKAILAARSW